MGPSSLWKIPAARAHIDLFKDRREVFIPSGTGGGDYWNRDIFANVFHKFNVKTAIAALL